MAFSLTETKQVSQWIDFESDDIKAKVKIRGIKYKPFVIANERIQNNFNVKGLNIEEIDGKELTFQDMLFKITAEYLIEDWQNLAIEQDGEVKDVPYDKDTAFKIMSQGGEDGIIFWDFVTTNAKNIQAEADKKKEEVLGKSENSTDGQKSEAVKKRASKTK